MMASACSSMSFWLPNIDDEVLHSWTTTKVRYPLKTRCRIWVRLLLHCVSLSLAHQMRHKKCSQISQISPVSVTAFRICMTCYRRKSTVWPVELILSQNNPKYGLFSKSKCMVCSVLNSPIKIPLRLEFWPNFGLTQNPFPRNAFSVRSLHQPDQKLCKISAALSTDRYFVVYCPI